MAIISIFQCEYLYINLIFSHTDIIALFNAFTVYR